MLIYNITTKINWNIQQDWLRWMHDIHIKTILNTGCFARHQFVRLLEIDEDDGPAYALQLYAENRENYLRYKDVHLPAIDAMSHERWKSNVISFATLLEIIG